MREIESVKEVLETKEVFGTVVSPRKVQELECASRLRAGISISEAGTIA